MSLQYNDPLEGQAFDQVNNILGDEEVSQHEVCHFKISELQKIVSTLTRTNERLIMRIEQLEEQADKRQKLEESVFNEEYSVLQCDFGDVEDMIKEYKKELEQYKQKVRKQISQQSKITDQLSDQNEQLRKANIDLRNEVDELKAQTEMLENTKEGLLSQIQELQSSLRKSKYEGPKYSINRSQDYDDYSTGSSGDFNLNVQYELQKLIEKLVKELEYERHMKKKMMEQIKQLQRDILEQEKQIINKNNKIYSLQISAIKSSKVQKIDRQARFNRFKGVQVNREEPRAQKIRSEPSRKRSFTLMQLMNECLVLGVKEKLVLSLKLIDLYSKKYQNNDFSSQILQSLVVSNYSQNNPHLCQVKVDSSIDKDQDHQAENQQELVWNLIFVLDNLLSQTSNRDRELGQSGSQETLLEAVSYFLENKEENNIEAVIELRKIVEEALTGLMR